MSTYTYTCYECRGIFSGRGTFPPGDSISSYSPHCPQCVLVKHQEQNSRIMQEQMRRTELDREIQSYSRSNQRQNFDSTNMSNEQFDLLLSLFEKQVRKRLDAKAQQEYVPAPIPVYTPPPVVNTPHPVSNQLPAPTTTPTTTKPDGPWDKILLWLAIASVSGIFVWRVIEAATTTFADEFKHGMFSSFLAIVFSTFFGALETGVILLAVGVMIFLVMKMFGK